jgi:hypothetical protein
MEIEWFKTIVIIEKWRQENASAFLPNEKSGWSGSSYHSGCGIERR